MPRAHRVFQGPLTAGKSSRHSCFLLFVLLMSISHTGTIELSVVDGLSRDYSRLRVGSLCLGVSFVRVRDLTLDAPFIIPYLESQDPLPESLKGRVTCGMFFTVLAEGREADTFVIEDKCEVSWSSFRVA